VARPDPRPANVNNRALGTQGPTGASTIVEAIDHAEMSAAAASLAERLELSGFHGLDFILDDDGAASLIELNPRATQVCHLRIGCGDSLVDALVGNEASDRIAAAGTTIALFPQAWSADPTNALLRTAAHDVPWEEPELLHELLAPHNLIGAGPALLAFIGRPSSRYRVRGQFGYCGTDRLRNTLSCAGKEGVNPGNPGFLWKQEE
jgi:hypothetical protein